MFVGRKGRAMIGFTIGFFLGAWSGIVFTAILIGGKYK
jgi:hypothetical protein